MNGDIQEMKYCTQLRPHRFMQVFLSTLLLSCSTTQQPPIEKLSVTVSLKDQKTDLDAIKTAVTENMDGIDKCAGNIGNETVSGEKKAPKLSEWEDIRKDVLSILKGTGNTRTELDKISPVGEALDKADLEINALNTYVDGSALEIENLKIDIKTKEDLIKEYKDGAVTQQRKIWVGVTALAAIGIAVGIALALWVSPQLGISLFIASTILTSISYCMLKYEFVVTIIGAVLLLSVFIAFIYMFVKNRKALVESVLSLEVMKDKKWEDVKNNVKQIQSNSTKKLVNEIKADKQI